MDLSRFRLSVSKDAVQDLGVPTHVGEALAGWVAHQMDGLSIPIDPCR